jgi:hypothetical protein
MEKDEGAAHNRSHQIQKLWIVVIFAGILCFMPLYQRSSSASGGSSYSDSNLLKGNRFFLDSCIFRLAITFSQIFDVSVEFGSQLVKLFIPDKRNAAVAPSSIKIARMKDGERLTFLLGLSAIALVFVPRLQNDLMVVLRCVTNFCTILTICPILMYLHRCTSTWNLPAAVAVALVVCTGSVLSSASLLATSAAPPTASLQRGVAVLFMIAVGLIGMLSLMCWIRCFISKLPYFRRLLMREGEAPNAELGASIHEMARFNEPKASVTSNNNTAALGPVARPTDDFYTNILPAAHMVCLIVLVWIALMSGLDWGADGYTMGMYNYVYMGLGLFVCVVELRVGRNQVSNSLVSELSCHDLCLLLLVCGPYR